VSSPAKVRKPRSRKPTPAGQGHTDPASGRKTNIGQKHKQVYQPRLNPVLAIKGPPIDHAALENIVAGNLGAREVSEGVASDDSNKKQKNSSTSRSADLAEDKFQPRRTQ
jgi:hypothetical protein